MKIARRAGVTTALGLVLLAGCRDGDLAKLLDEDSQRRLAAAPEEATLLVSLRSEAEPSFDEGARLVQRSGDLLLIEGRRSSLDRLAALPAVTHAAVWGTGDVLRKLDPSLRGDLLQACADDLAGTAQPMLATFSPEANDVAALVAARGATLRSLSGGVATLDADVAAAWRLLELPELIELEKPSTLRPLEGAERRE